MRAAAKSGHLLSLPAAEMGRNARQSVKNARRQIMMRPLTFSHTHKSNICTACCPIKLTSLTRPLARLSFQALSGFLMMLTQNGKLLYISDNAAEYLGHSMVSTKFHFLRLFLSIPFIRFFVRFVVPRRCHSECVRI